MKKFDFSTFFIFPCIPCYLGSDSPLFRTGDLR